MNTSRFLMRLLMLGALSTTVALTGCSDDDDADGPTSDTGVADTGDAGMDPDSMDPDGMDPDGMDPDVTEDPQPRGADNPPALDTAQIDRAGRAAISTALIGTFESDDDAKGTLKDSYNAAGAADFGSFAASIAPNLAILDSLDANCGNQLLAGETADAGRYDALAGILADDQLYVNTGSGDCGVYLGLEAEIVGAIEEGAGGCGGRTLGDDVIDRSYSVLAAGILTGVDDTITANDVVNSEAFPYLAAPQQ
ncbi:MAG: hypothetical protein ACJA1R_000383 [Flavobacteriales bacterium]|jgi:hypothetical protein